MSVSGSNLANLYRKQNNINLPSEIIKKIISFAVTTSALDDVLRLRLINKEFNYFVIEAMFENADRMDIANFLQRWMESSLIKLEISSLDYTMLPLRHSLLGLFKLSNFPRELILGNVIKFSLMNMLYFSSVGQDVAYQSELVFAKSSIKLLRLCSAVWGAEIPLVAISRFLSEEDRTSLVLRYLNTKNFKTTLYGDQIHYTEDFVKKVDVLRSIYGFLGPDQQQAVRDHLSEVIELPGILFDVAYRIVEAADFFEFKNYPALARKCLENGLDASLHSMPEHYNNIDENKIIAVANKVHGRDKKTFISILQAFKNKMSDSSSKYGYQKYRSEKNHDMLFFSICHRDQRESNLERSVRDAFNGLIATNNRVDSTANELTDSIHLMALSFYRLLSSERALLMSSLAELYFSNSSVTIGSAILHFLEDRFHKLASDQRKMLASECFKGLLSKRGAGETGGSNFIGYRVNDFRLFSVISPYLGLEAKARAGYILLRLKFDDQTSNPNINRANIGKYFFHLVKFDDAVSQEHLDLIYGFILSSEFKEGDYIAIFDRFKISDKRKLAETFIKHHFSSLQGASGSVFQSLCSWLSVMLFDRDVNDIILPAFEGLNFGSRLAGAQNFTLLDSLIDRFNNKVDFILESVGRSMAYKLTPLEELDKASLDNSVGDANKIMRLEQRVSKLESALNRLIGILSSSQSGSLPSLRELAQEVTDLSLNEGVAVQGLQESPISFFNSTATTSTATSEANNNEQLSNQFR